MAGLTTLFGPPRSNRRSIRQLGRSCLRPRTARGRTGTDVAESILRLLRHWGEDGRRRSAVARLMAFEEENDGVARSGGGGDGRRTRSRPRNGAAAGET